MYEGTGFFCDDCAEKHTKECEDFADYAKMPVVNSPAWANAPTTAARLTPNVMGCLWRKRGRDYYRKLGITQLSELLDFAHEHGL